jgi:kinetochore protein NNF1
MPSRTSASPSPPPQRPVASTPGVRAAALQKIFATALAATLKANSYANFSACFPTPAQHCPSALEGVWRQLNTKLEEGCTREFEAILQERNVVEGLNEWDSRIEDARRRLNRGIDGEEPARPYADSTPAFFSLDIKLTLTDCTRSLLKSSTPHILHHVYKKRHKFWSYGFNLRNKTIKL